MRYICTIGLFLLSGWISSLSAQRIFYAETERDDVRQVNFEILGKYNNQYLIYKNIRNRHYITIYDASMKLKDKVELDFIPDRAVNVDAFGAPGQISIIYQYMKKGVVYCMGVRLDREAKKITEPMELDTTDVGFFGDNKVYSVITSDDKQKFMVFKMKNRQRDLFHFQTLLLNSNLMPVRRAKFDYILENSRESIADFYLDNEGNFLFSHVARPGIRDNINKANLCVLKVFSDTLSVFPLTLKNVFLDELRIKVDNTNNRYILSSLYSKTGKGNIDGLFIAFVNKDLGADMESGIEFNDELRQLAKGDNSLKSAFNDYYLKHFIVKKDGGVLITGESAYNNSRSGNGFNRWDNPLMWGSPAFPGGYYGWSPWNNFGYGSWRGMYGGNNWTSQQSVRYFCDNVIVLSVSKDGVLQWNSIVIKAQYDDNTDNLLSYQIMNSGAELLFLYNEWNRRTAMMAAQSLSPEGKVSKEPPLKSLDKGYEFMIRMGKQVASREMITPVLYRNNLSFARIEF